MSAGYVKPAEAERILGVDRRTLKKWASAGHIKFLQPGGKGQRLYDVSSVGVTAPATAPTNGPVKAIYARVSTRKQLPDLKVQIDDLKAKYPDHVVFSDCASGLNFKRKGLLSLLQLAFERRLQVVRIAYRDRLCRFAYDLIEHILKSHGAEICVESDDQHSPEQELAEDVVAIITVFGARLYGARSGRSRKQAAAAGAAAAAAAAAAASAGGSSGGSSGGGGAEAEGTFQTGSGLGWAAADLQGVDAPDREAGGGVEAVLRGGEDSLQLCTQPRKKRKQTQRDSASNGLAPAASAGMGKQPSN